MSHVSIDEDRIIAGIEGINIIIGGHDHFPFLLEENGTLIVKCGQNIEKVGLLDLNLSRAFTGTTALDYSFNLLSTKGVMTNPDVDHLITEWCTKTSDGGDDEVICIVEEDAHLSTRTAEVRTCETAFACHVADAILWSYREMGHQCDFAIQNGGFIRGDAAYPPGMAITKKMLMEELPFSRIPILLLLKGKDICSGISQMLPPLNIPVGSFPHFSEGISAEYTDSTSDDGNRVFNVKARGIPLELDQEYAVVISDFFAFSNGDGVTAFSGKPVLHNHGKKISDVMTDYLRFLGSISGKCPKRLVKL